MAPGRDTGAASPVDTPRSSAEFDELLGERDRLRGELERSQAELDAERVRLERDLAVMRRVQLSLMPECPLGPPGYELATAYRPARVVGGDFYDAYTVPGRPSTVGLAIADVTGKGITAALLMAFARAVMRGAAYNGAGPADALTRTNRVLMTDVRTGLFLTAWMAELDGATGVLRYAIAGHERPLLLHGPTGEIEELAGEGVLVGAFERLEIEERAVALEPGDLLVAYTDGVTDAIDPDGRRFGSDRLVDAIRDHAGSPARAALDGIIDAVLAFTREAPAADDLTLVAVRRAA